MSNLEYKQVHCAESWGSHGAFGLKILIHAGREFNDNDRRAMYRIADQIEAAVMGETMRLDPKQQERSVAQRAALLECFPVGEPIYVKTVPNGYCSRWCCLHLPWFLVTTRLGVIKIGWRKSVISIDWSESDIGTMAEDLFAAERVTKEGRLIHAHGYDKAREYLGRLMQCAPATVPA